LPFDDGAVVSCSVCIPSWVASFVPSDCALGYRTKFYSDSNSCGVLTNFPFDNGTIVSCNILSSIGTNHSVNLFDNFSIIVGAPFNVPSVNVTLQYPNLSLSNFSTSWNGVAFETPSIAGFSSGSYVMTAFAGNQSLSNSFIIHDFEAVIPTQYTGVVLAGSNFSFFLEFYTNSSYNLTHSISCSVPSGFSCIVPASLDVVGYGNVSVIITSNNSLVNGSYVGSLNVTRLIDGRVFSSVLNLGISNSFGVPQIVNPSSFVEVMYSNDVRSKEYIVRNVGTFALSNCSVSIDGSFVGKSFVSGSKNFSLGINESKTFSVSYSSPSAGTYTGYFNVFCVADSFGVINGLSNPQFQQLFVLPFIPSVPPSNGGGAGGSPSPIISYSNVSNFVLLNSGGVASGYVSYSYPLNTFSKTFIVKSNVADSLSLRVSCRGDFCQYVKFSSDSFSLAGFGNDFFTATVSVPKNVDINSVYSYEVVLTDGSGQSMSLINSVHISTLSAWYSKFALIVREGDRGFWFSVGSFNVPKLLLFLLLVLIVDVATIWVLPKDKFYQKNIVLILTFMSLIVFGLSALLF
jgi:hypothetical protein